MFDVLGSIVERSVRIWCAYSLSLDPPPVHAVICSQRRSQWLRPDILVSDVGLDVHDIYPPVIKNELLVKDGW